MYRIGIDLGGTNIVAGVVNEDYKIISRSSTKTNAPRPAGQIADDMAKVAKEAVEKAGLTMADIEYVGIGSPGAVNPKTGCVAFSNNLDFYDVPLGDMLKERMGVDCFVENDANAAAYGEYIAGAGKGTDNFIAITLGTGVGGGVIIGGKIYSGSNYAGAELGHVTINMNGEVCTCGRIGCWEAYASATALIRQTKQAMLRYPNSIMWQLCDNNPDNVNGITAFDAMRKSDVAGSMVVDQYLYFVAVGIANVLNIFQPEVICIGGGISHEGDTLIAPIKRLVYGDNFARNLSKKADIKVAQLGNDAGIIGAAYLNSQK
ncbi:MAG: ROK family glucokinase [Clostridia bacterium]|nr:ROK family glucokinase [Clostridia bacterium]